MSQTLPELFAARAPEPSRPFLRDTPGGLDTYLDLETEVRRWACRLMAAGIRPGDRVVYQVEKSPAVLTLHLALLRCGAIQVPVNPAYPDREVAVLLADADPALVIRDPARVAVPGAWQSVTLDANGTGTARELANDDDIAMPTLRSTDGVALLYTSGTTGRPKGALLTHANLVHNAKTLVDAWGFTHDDVLLHILPLFHTHGLFAATHCVLASGASLVLLPTFDVLRSLEALPHCSVLMGVPTHYSRLLADHRFNASLVRGMRLFVSGSAPMSPALHAAFEAQTGRTVLERYGMTETSMLASNPLDGVRKPGSVGPPLPGVAVRVVDDVETPLVTRSVGHVQVRGPNVFGGYWRRPDLADKTFTDDGWFRTGDLGAFDSDGYLELVGRSKDLIISGGLNIYPQDVEDVLDALVGVRESAVFGVPDQDLGERIVAVVVADESVDLDPEELRSAARQRLAGYQVPKRIVIVESLPRNAMGKVAKTVLREVAKEWTT
ncbi:MAG: AMP-binding protein [Actinomycetia bacterium]|nr:AMP-binding protein [Actinomycetes bacterium]